MCGITGIFGFRDKESARNTVKKMNDCIAHRGPDADGIWNNEKCALGHRRLSIIDTSAAGNQPFFSEDKNLVIVFNGEIYNYIELKKELSSQFEFKTESDTEVILAAYQKWGIHCIEKFFGMFALALWDASIESLYVVRDRLGVKPLYYSKTSEGIFFASEIRALLATGVIEKKISEEALSDYLRYQTVHAPSTIIRDIQMLMPGHYMKLDANGVTEKRYWSLNENINHNSATEDLHTVQKNIRSLLTSSVEIRMRADVPFGAFLSGGIDSSAIVGLMSGISSRPIKTFSITFDEKEFDESTYSEVIAKKFHTDHTPIRLSASHFLNLVPEALTAMDHPSGDGPNTYVVSKATREAGVKMALSGLGGDEIFAGYDIFKRVKNLESKKWLNNLPLFSRKLAGQALRNLKPSISSEKIAATLSGKIDFAHFYPLSRQVLMDHDARKLLKSQRLADNTVSKLMVEIDQSNVETLSKVSMAEIGTYMQNVLLRDADQMSMAHALEVRVPFLDHRLVEYVLGVSDEKKYPHTPKELLTSSLSDLLPREIIDRPKMGFTFPWESWMKNELRSFCEQQMEALKNIECLNHHEAMKLWHRFLAGDNFITWSRIWPLVVLGHWVKQHGAN